MKIIKATVLTGQGPDRVFLVTDLPSPFSAYVEPLTLSFEAESGTGVLYVADHFNLEATAVDRGAKLQPFRDREG